MKADLQPSFPNAWRGLWGMTWRSSLAGRRWAALGSLLFVNPVLAALVIEPGATEAMLDWTTSFYLQLMAPMYCLVVCGAMIRDEVQAETLGFLTTRPLTRARIFLLKYLCQVTWVQAVLAVNAALLLVVGLLRKVPETLSLAGYLIGAQVLVVFAYCALSAFLGLLTRRYVVLGVVYGFVVEIGIGHIPTNINALSMLRHVQTLLGNVAAVEEEYGWSPAGSGVAVLIMLVATVLFLAAGAALFTFKEFHASDETPKS